MRAALSVVVVVMALACEPAAGDSRQKAQVAAVHVPEMTGDSSPERLRVQVHARHPHDPGAFTQGLVWGAGRLFESTGLEGRSSLREVDWQTGTVRRQLSLDDGLFGEGLAMVGTELIQLTWKNGRAFARHIEDFSPKRVFSYEGEGWGLCYDGTALVMSDGSSMLYFRNPDTFAVERTLSVLRDGRAQYMLNELECAHGRVYANVWQTDEIVRIDPITGIVDGVIDASELRREQPRNADVLNGIAFVGQLGRFLVTGKLWPIMYEVTFVPRPSQ